LKVNTVFVGNPKLRPVLVLLLELLSIIMGDNDDIEYIEVSSSPFPSSSTVDPDSDLESE
jgi:hypothetical protein